MDEILDIMDKNVNFVSERPEFSEELSNNKFRDLTLKNKG